jgi:competence protein ComEC
MLPSLTAAFLLGLLGGSQIPFFPVSVFILSAAAAVGLSLLERTGRLESRYSLFIYGSSLAGVLYWTLVVPPHTPEPFPKNRRDIPVTEMSGRIVAPVQHGPGRQTIIVEAEAANQESRYIKLLWRDPDGAVHQGDRISFSAKAHQPSSLLNPGGFDYAAYLERQGIDVVATVTGPGAVQVLESGSGSWRWAIWNQLDRWRGTIREAAVQTLRQPALGILLGIVIGERGYLEQELQEWFMVTGTVHLLSISGSHLGLVAFVVFWIVKRLLLWLPPLVLLNLSRTVTPTRMAILLTWPPVLLYALLAGAELATIRSLVMITLALVALWLGHERHLTHAMAVAALLILLHAPQAIFDISFQLSFLSVFMIVHIVQRLGEGEKEATNDTRSTAVVAVQYLRDAVIMSGSVTLATLPVVAFYFQQVPWMGIVTNLLAIPFTGMILVPLGLLAALWTVFTGSDGLAMGAILDIFLNWMVHVLRWCAGLPGGEWHVAAPSIPAIALFYLGLVAVCSSHSPRRTQVIGACLVAFFVTWWMLSPRVGLDGDRWRVTFLDVGQGDSAVVELPDGKTLLIDGGARYERFDMGRGVVAPFLWNRGIRHIDEVVGTHQQLDHVGGLIWVLRHLSVGRYWGTGVDRPEQFVSDLKEAVTSRHISEARAVRGEEMLGTGACRMEILNPPDEHKVSAPVRRESGTDLNNRSIVSRLQCGSHSVLFSADIEVEGLHQLPEDGRRPVTILKVPHHGAKSSLDPDWVRQVHPRYAVISVGRANSYGHPAPSVIQAYDEYHIGIARTDLDGAIWFKGRLSTDELTLTTMRELMVERVDPSRCLWSCEQENWRRLWRQFRDRTDMSFFGL